MPDYDHKRVVVLRADAIVTLALGLALLASTWDRLYAELRIPAPSPWLYGMLAGAGAIAASLVMWSAAGRAELAVPVARAAALGNGLAAVALGAWLLSDDVGVPDAGSRGAWLVEAVLVVLAVFAVLELNASRR